MATGSLVVTVKPSNGGMGPEEFQHLLRTKIFPEIHKGPTRVGEIVSWTVLQPFDNSGTGRTENSEYVWLINWDGLQDSARLASSALDKLRALGFDIHERNFAILDSSAQAAA
jgi:hypothetical protein